MLYPTTFVTVADAKFGRAKLPDITWDDPVTLNEPVTVNPFVIFVLPDTKKEYAVLCVTGISALMITTPLASILSLSPKLPPYAVENLKSAWSEPADPGIPHFELSILAEALVVRVLDAASANQILP